MCTVFSEHGIHIAPSTDCDHLDRGPSTRMLADAQLIDAIYMLRNRQPFMKVLGSPKTWIVLRNNGIDVARCTFERLMAQMRWHGASRKKSMRTTTPDRTHARLHPRHTIVSEMSRSTSRPAVPQDGDVGRSGRR